MLAKNLVVLTLGQARDLYYALPKDREFYERCQKSWPKALEAINALSEAARDEAVD